MKKKRVDELLIEQNLIRNKSEALAYVMSGKVFTKDEIKILTVGEKYKSDTQLYIKSDNKKYVSRGGYKLEKALKYFNIQVKNKIVLDIGSSTGGFTDVSLRAGAKLVYALDVGTNQLAWNLRTNDKVIVMEQTNFRYSTPDDFTQGFPSIATIDVSFISLKHILLPLYSIITNYGDVIALIKPQFEAKKEDVSEGGVIKDTSIYKNVLKQILNFSIDSNFSVENLTISPIKGAEGNVEFLVHLIKNGENKEDIDQLIKETLAILENE